MEEKNIIAPKLVAQSLPFEGSLALTREAVMLGETTGSDQSDFLAQVTKDNLALMERTYQTPLRPDLVQMVQALTLPEFIKAALHYSKGSNGQALQEELLQLVPQWAQPNSEV